jgi:hypothetical protein
MTCKNLEELTMRLEHCTNSEILAMVQHLTECNPCRKMAEDCRARVERRDPAKHAECAMRGIRIGMRAMAAKAYDPELNNG